MAANCIQSLGDIARERSITPRPRPNSNRRSRSMSKRLAAGSGQLHQASGRHRADTLHITPRPRPNSNRRSCSTSKVGSLQGQTNCIESLGDIALQRSQEAEARKNFEAALILYERIEEPFSIGWTHRRLARLSDGSERSRHVEAARSACRKRIA